MKVPPSDEDLRRRVQDLGRREGAGAPPLDRLLRGRGPASEVRPAESGLAGWRRPAAALTGVLVCVAVLAWWRPMPRQDGGPVVSSAAMPSGDSTEEWDLPTDGLLTEAGNGVGRRDVERLSREIEGLLQP